MIRVGPRIIVQTLSRYHEFSYMFKNETVTYTIPNTATANVEHASRKSTWLDNLMAITHLTVPRIMLLNAMVLMIRM